MRPTPYDIIVISGSAGALEGVREILTSLPSDLPAAVVLVVHHAAERTEMLANILRRRSHMPLGAVVEGDSVRPGRVYLAPADLHMRIGTDHRIECGDGRKINYLRSSSEPLLESVAKEYASRAIVVILSGTGKNGAAGAKKVHDAGGTVLVQDAATSRQFGMPQAAIAAGTATKVLPIERIGPELLALTGATAPAA